MTRMFVEYPGPATYGKLADVALYKLGTEGEPLKLTYVGSGRSTEIWCWAESANHDLHLATDEREPRWVPLSSDALTDAVARLFEGMKTTKMVKDEEIEMDFPGGKRHISEICAMIRAHSSRREPGDERQNITDTEISVQNGYLRRVSPAEDVWELMPHTSTRFNTENLAFDYDPEAGCPRWEKYLDEVTADDPSKRTLLEEIVGWIFAGQDTRQVFAYIVGRRGSGKSTFINILEELLGETCTTSTLEALPTPFGASQLIGKRVVMVPEVDDWTANIRGSVVSFLKSLTGGDKVRIEAKNKDAYARRLNVKPFIIGNESPNFHDPSGALQQRMVICRFEQNFRNSPNRDEHLETKLKRELPGIFNWALSCVKRYRATQDSWFTMPASSKVLYDETRSMARPVYTYTSQHIVADADAWVPKRDVYDMYVRWAGGEHQKVEAHGVFTPQLRNSVEEIYPTAQIREGQKTINGKNTLIWRGIRLRAPLEVEREKA